MKDRVKHLQDVSLKMKMNEFENTAVMSTLYALSVVIRDRERNFEAWMVDRNLAADALSAASLIIASTYENYLNSNSRAKLAVQRIKDLDFKIKELESLLENREEELEILKS